MPELQYHQQCLVCSNHKLQPLEQYQKAHLCKCSKCGFVFAQKIPSSQELEEHYEGYDRNDYLSPITIKRYNELLDKMEGYRKTNTLIDVGCGIGYFLEESIKRDWVSFGTEFTDEAVEICSKKNILMNKGVLNPSDYEPSSFDIITSFEVIEHINNPIEEISNFHKILRKGGLVYITTPNFNSLLRYHLKEQYNVITYPEHLSYYTPKTLTKLFKQCGFKAKKIETTGLSLTRLKTSKKVSTEKFISKSSTDEVIRKKVEEKKHLQLAKKIANQTLSIVGVGDTIKGWFEKG